MKPYSELTERGQARRLRLLACNALRQYDLPVARLRLVTNDMNGIFRVDAADGQAYILRVSLPEGGHTLDHIRAETDWLLALRRDTALSLPRPIPARSGDFFVEATAPGVPEARVCAVFTRVRGTDLADHLSTATMAKLGELSAQLHAHAASYRPPGGEKLLRFDCVFPFPDEVVLFEERLSAFFPPARRKTFLQAHALAQAAVDRLKASGEPMRILHGDLHQWNVRYDHGVLSPIDFEDLMWGWPVQDIATTLYYFLVPETYPLMRQAFQEGYTRHAPWPERYVGEINAFLCARALGMANFVLSTPNPKWKNQAVEFTARIDKRLRWLMKMK